MNIAWLAVTIGQLAKGFVDNAIEGARAYGGLLDVRPPYQREFIYKGKQRDDVVRSVRSGFPLNVMYWVKNPDGSTYGLLDGQQRTISICQYVSNKFMVDGFYFANLTDEEQQQILDYKLLVYVCEGSDREVLDWFRVINMAGEKLTEQEQRNAVYTGPWLSDAKQYFSKPSCAAYSLAGMYVKGAPIRQEVLETALRWAGDGDIVGYMARHQYAPDAKPLWNHFVAVIEWAKRVFPPAAQYPEMRGVNFGALYAQFKDAKLDPADIARRIETLMGDEDVTNKSGIFPYVLTGEEKRLNIRKFSKNQKREAYQRQNGLCPRCKEKFALEDMEGDHITPWKDGGKTTPDNCQMLCKPCNRKKSAH